MSTETSKKPTAAEPKELLLSNALDYFAIGVSLFTCFWAIVFIMLKRISLHIISVIEDVLEDPEVQIALNKIMETKWQRPSPKPQAESNFSEMSGASRPDSVPAKTRAELNQVDDTLPLKEKHSPCGSNSAENKQSSKVSPR